MNVSGHFSGAERPLERLLLDPKGGRGKEPEGTEDDTTEDVISAAIRFNDQINNQDLDKLTELMSEDHRSVDMGGKVVEGREEMSKGWAQFFEWFPDYRNIFSCVEARGNLVIMIGRSECSYEPLHGPAVWTTKIGEGFVTEWRVYRDTEETRKILGIN